MASHHTLGVIGVGNMGAALVRGLVAAEALDPEENHHLRPRPRPRRPLAAETGVAVAADASSLAAASDYVALRRQALGRRPGASEYRAGPLGRTNRVSFAAGVTLRTVRDALTRVQPTVIRVMPNTPALVGAGAFALAAPEAAPEKVDAVRGMLAAIGRVVIVSDDVTWTPPPPSAAAGPPSFSCSSKPWPTVAWRRACRAPPRRNSPPRPSSAPPRWSSKPASTRRTQGYGHHPGRYDHRRIGNTGRSRRARRLHRRRPRRRPALSRTLRREVTYGFRTIFGTLNT